MLQLKELLAENAHKSCLELYEEIDKKIMRISGSGLKDDITFFMLQVS